MGGSWTTRHNTRENKEAFEMPAEVWGRLFVWPRQKVNGEKEKTGGDTAEVG